MAKEEKIVNKTKKMWEIRYYPSPITFSDSVGHKGKLKTLDVARKIVKRLRKSGIDAFRAPIMINYQVKG